MIEDICVGIIGSIMLLWAVAGVVIGCEYIFKNKTNNKQKIFIYILGGPLLWIVIPYIVAIGYIAGIIAFIYDSLGDKK